MQEKFPNALFYEDLSAAHVLLKNRFAFEDKSGKPIILHVKGTPFQLKVWEALLKIESGKACTYSKLPIEVSHGKASRAAGSALCLNLIAI